jgi:hypothetical protein
MPRFVVVALVYAVTSIKIELFGNTTLGYYYMDVFLGPEAETQSLIFDTGSDRTLTDCDKCKSCGIHQHPYYKPSGSWSEHDPHRFQNFFCSYNNCGFEAIYSEGSQYRGQYMRELFRFNYNDDSFETVIGCVTEETGLFVTQEADGIIGMSPNHYSPSQTNEDPPSPLDSAIIQGKLKDSKMSICLGSDGGIMSLGNMNYDLHRRGESLQTIKLNPELWKDQYKINLDLMMVDQEPVQYNFRRLSWQDQQGFFDTGTTLVYFPEELMAKIGQSFTIFCQKEHENCGTYSEFGNCFRNGWFSSQNDETFLNSFPIITFHFEGSAKYNWNPQNYFVKSGKHDFCITFSEAESLVFGASLFKNYDVLLDKENSEISFIEADCQGKPSKYRHLTGRNNGRNDRLNKIIMEYNSHLRIWGRLESALSGFEALAITACVLALAIAYSIMSKFGKSHRHYHELVDVDLTNINI